MAFELYRWTFPAIAASAVNAGDAVMLTASALERQVFSVGSINQEPFGVSLATANYLAATPPFTAAVPCVDQGNTIKVRAIASLGVGANVGVGTTSTASGWAIPVAAASGVDTWRVGRAVSPAAAGEIFGLYVSPRLLSSTVR